MFLQTTWLIYFFYSVITCDSAEYSLDNKTAIITGAARGIGYAIADNFLAEGAKLIIILDKNDTNGVAAADRLNEKYGCDRAVFYHCHVYNDRDFWDYLITVYQDIDILVNDAGIMDEYEIIEMIHTNFAALVLWSVKFTNYNRMDYNGPGGSIINLSSRAGYGVFPFVPVYSASKSAVSSFTQNFGHEYNYKKTGVRVFAVCPDFADTELLKGQMVVDENVEVYQKFLAITKLLTADQVAKAIVKLYRTVKTGTLWKIDSDGISKAPLIEYVKSEDIEKL